MSEKTGESSKSLTDGESQLTDEFTTEEQPLDQQGFVVYSEELKKFAGGFQELTQEINGAIPKCQNKETTDKMRICVERMGTLIKDLENGRLKSNVGGYFCRRYNDYFAALLKYDKDLSEKFEDYCGDLAKKYTALSMS